MKRLLLRGLPGRVEPDLSPEGWTEVPVGRGGPEEQTVLTETLPSPSACTGVLSASLDLFCVLPPDEVILVPKEGS